MMERRRFLLGMAAGALLAALLAALGTAVWVKVFGIQHLAIESGSASLSFGRPKPHESPGSTTPLVDAARKHVERQAQAEPAPAPATATADDDPRLHAFGVPKVGQWAIYRDTHYGLTGTASVEHEYTWIGAVDGLRASMHDQKLAPDLERALEPWFEGLPFQTQMEFTNLVLKPLLADKLVEIEVGGKKVACIVESVTAKDGATTVTFSTHDIPIYMGLLRWMRVRYFSIDAGGRLTEMHELMAWGESGGGPKPHRTKE